MTPLPDQSSSPRESARALLRACGRNGYRAEPDSQVLTAAELGELDAEQLDGLRCAFCGGCGGAMVPITRTPTELFVHADPCELAELAHKSPELIGSLYTDLGSEVDVSTYPVEGHDLVRMWVANGGRAVVVHMTPHDADELAEQLQRAARRCRT